MGYRRILDHRDRRIGKHLGSQLATIGFTDSGRFWERPNERHYVGKDSLILLLLRPATRAIKDNDRPRTLFHGLQAEIHN